MNINEYKSAYDNVHATKSLKKKVADASRKKQKKKESRAAHFLLPVLGGAAVTAAALALSIIGAGFLKELFAERLAEPETAQKPVPVTESAAAPLSHGVIGELRSPLDDLSPEIYEIMPAANDPEIAAQPDHAVFRSAFKDTFTGFGPELVDFVGREDFNVWVESLASGARASYGQTFYNQMTHLAYVTYFEISQKEAEKLFTSYYGSIPGFGDVNDAVRAVSNRDEELCCRLFMNSGLPLVNRDDSGFVFYTLSDLYEMPPREIAALLREKNDMQAETLVSLQSWADELSDPVYSAAVRRKRLLVEAELYESSRPALEENSPSFEFYPQKVCDLSEYLDIDGCVIFNYVRRLAEQSASDENALLTAIGGSTGEANYNTIPSYNRLLYVNGMNITSEDLLEALTLIDLHYYCQKNQHLYSEQELKVIVYGTSEEFTDFFLYPWVMRTTINPVGSMMWKTPSSLYNSGVSTWLTYGDLNAELLEGVLAQFDGVQAEFFRRKIKLYKEIRLITAAYLDGGALEADDELLPEAPVFPSEASLTYEIEGQLQNGEEEEPQPFLMSASELYYAKMIELAKLGVGADTYMSLAESIIGNCLPDAACERYLLMKVYLYCLHVDRTNLYNARYLGILLADASYDYATDGQSVYITHTVPSSRESMDEYIKSYLRQWHITSFVNSLSQLNASRAKGTENLLSKIKRGEYPEIDEDRYSAYFMPIKFNPLLPESGERGLFCCAAFGYDKWLDTEHYGMDFATSENEPIAVFDSGTVSFAG